MADISILSRLVNGAVRNVDLTTNTPVVLSIKIGGVTNTELTKAILDNLVTLQNGSDISASLHHHDGRYFTETELGSSSSSSGSDLIGDDDTYTNFTPSAATVKGALAGIDAALAGAGTDEFVKVSSNDTTAGYVEDKFVVDNGTNSTNPLEATTLNDGGDEDYRIRFDQSKVDHGALAGLADDDHTQYTLADGSRAFTGDQSMGSNKLTSLAAGTNAADATRKDQQVLRDGSQDFTANQSMGGFKLTSLGAPTASADAATKAYVDSVAEGLRPKEAVRVATTTAGTLASSFENGDSVDGVTLVTGDRILLKNQAAAEENGIYTVNASGAPTRATDFDSLSPIDEINGAMVAVQEGTENAGKVFVQTGTVAIIDTDPINFVFYNSSASLVGGDGITVSGSNISVDHDGEGLQFTANQLALELDGSTLSKSSSGVKVATGGITDTEINASADITLSKLAALTANRALQSNGSGVISVSAVTSTELGYLSGVTSAIQTQLNDKASTALDNLATTSINADLLPSADITRNLGSSTLKWLNLYARHLRGSATGPRIDLTTGEMYDSSNVLSADFSNRELSITGLTKVNWSGDSMSLTNTNNQNIDILPQGSGAVNVGSKKIINLADPTAAQDAATKAYVDAAGSKLQSTEVAGESIAATTLFAMRYAKAADVGFVAGRIYKADNDASSVDNFYAIGVLFLAGSASAGDNVALVKNGLITATSHGFTVGQPVFLGAAGVITDTAPSAAGTAVVRLGMVKDANTIDINIAVVGVN